MKVFSNLIWVKTLILFGYPIFLSLILEVFIQQPSYSNLPNFIENVIFGLILIFVVNQLVCIKYGKSLSNIVIVLFYLGLLIETALYLVFQIRLNAAYIYVVLNTNFNEIKEFSTVYYSQNLIWLFFYFLPLFFLMFFKNIYKSSRLYLISFLFSMIIVFAGISVIKVNHIGKWNLPFIAIKSYIEYKQQLKDIESFSKNTLNVKTKVSTQNQTIVVLIGESTNRHNMGIYNYHRETTPQLKSMIDSLSVYKDVISSKVYTTGSIFDMFNLKINKSIEPASLIQFLKISGYKTYWISNQRPVGLNDNLVSKLASQADDSVFLSYNDFRHNTLHDEVLLPILDKKLLNKEPKVIFIHLIGTHYDYSKRYPTEFSKFHSKFKNKKNQIIDSYDNAILYNDFIVYQVIKKVSKASSKSGVIYFSDHGEEVFIKKEIFGHFQDNPTSSMYEIPFLVYMGSNFEKPTDFIIDETRKYMMNDFSHSLIHFMGIETRFLDKSRSIFSNSFIVRERKIQDTLDFDTLKQNEKK